MQEITIFNKSHSIHEIREYFRNEKKPFIVRNEIKSKINLDFLNDKFKKDKINIKGCLVSTKSSPEGWEEIVKLALDKANIKV